MSADPIITKGELPITREDDVPSILLPADPDDGLSDTEKAEVVSTPHPPSLSSHGFCYLFLHSYFGVC